MDRDPVAEDAILAVTVYVNKPPTGTFTVSLMFPLPFAVQVAPPVDAHVHVALITDGNVSVTVAPVIFAGPAFDTTIVYVTEVPGV